MKSWHLDRRTFLLGSGVSMALPYMEAMGEQAQAGDLPARMCAMYFPFGISLPKEDSDLPISVSDDASYSIVASKSFIEHREIRIEQIQPTKVIQNQVA